MQILNLLLLGEKVWKNNEAVSSNNIGIQHKWIVRFFHYCANLRSTFCKIHNRWIPVNCNRTKLTQWNLFTMIFQWILFFVVWFKHKHICGYQNYSRNRTLVEDISRKICKKRNQLKHWAEEKIILINEVLVVLRLRTKRS